MNSEFQSLTFDQKCAVTKAIEMAGRLNSRATVNASDGAEAYAYPHPGGSIAWGFNGGEHGFCIARGVVEG